MTLKKIVPAGVFQVGDRSLVTEDEALARYKAAQDWFDAHGHMVISSGPYLLERYDPAAQFAELTAFRDPTYPFSSTDFALGWRLERVRLAGAPTRMMAPRATPNGSTVALLTFPGHGVVVAAASNISPAEGVDPLSRKIAEAFTRPRSNN